MKVEAFFSREMCLFTFEFYLVLRTISHCPYNPGLILREPATSKDVGVDPDEVRESSSAAAHEGLHPI